MKVCLLGFSFHGFWHFSTAEQKRALDVKRSWRKSNATDWRYFHSVTYFIQAEHIHILYIWNTWKVYDFHLNVLSFDSKIQNLRLREVEQQRLREAELERQRLVEGKERLRNLNSIQEEILQLNQLLEPSTQTQTAVLSSVGTYSTRGNQLCSQVSEVVRKTAEVSVKFFNEKRKHIRLNTLLFEYSGHWFSAFWRILSSALFRKSDANQRSI